MRGVVLTVTACMLGVAAIVHELLVILVDILHIHSIELQAFIVKWGGRERIALSPPESQSGMHTSTIPTPWSAWEESHFRPIAYQAIALTTELQAGYLEQT